MKLITRTGRDALMSNGFNETDKATNGIIQVPSHMGSGYIKGFIINPQLRLLVRQYELAEDWMLDRGMGDDEKNMVLIAFHDIYQSKKDFTGEIPLLSHKKKNLPSVQLATSGFNIEQLQGKKKVNSILITVDRAYLRQMLKPKSDDLILQNIVSGNHPFLFEELVSPKIQEVAAEIIQAHPAEELQNLFYRIKTEELIYLLFVELLKRDDDTAVRSINVADIKKIYAIKTQILSTIETPPAMADLVMLSGMSESKLKRLFKQVFGNSIYNYYQRFRMKEAAYLIKEEKLSVSEAGYRLGFSNLSHFSRLFETHIGVKPKKYSQS